MTDRARRNSEVGDLGLKVAATWVMRVYQRDSPCAHRELDALEIVKRDPSAMAETKDRKLEPSRDAGSVSCRGTEIPHAA